MVRWLIASASGQGCTYNIQSPLHLLKMRRKKRWILPELELFPGHVCSYFTVNLEVLHKVWDCNSFCTVGSEIIKMKLFPLWRFCVDLGSSESSHGTFLRRLPALQWWFADPTVYPKIRCFISFLCLLGLCFCGLFSLPSPGKGHTLATVVKIWCVTSISVFFLSTQGFLCAEQRPLIFHGTFHQLPSGLGGRRTEPCPCPLASIFVQQQSSLCNTCRSYTLFKGFRGQVREKEVNPPGCYNSVLLCWLVTQSMLTNCVCQRQ